MKEIDLHGLSHEDAILTLEDFLLLESSKSNDSFECRVITGNSHKLQIRIIKEVLDKYDFNWISVAYNPGVLIVSETFL